MTVFFLDSTKTMIWIWKFGDQILALNERPYDVAASRWPTPSQWNCCWNRIPSCMGMMTNVTLIWMIIIIVKISSCDDADFRVKIETGNGAGNQLVTLLKQFSQQWIILQGNIKIYLHSLNKCLQKQMQLYIWCQVIMMANKEDAGQYVCQVGAVPISHLFQLGTVHLSGRLII